MVQIREAGEEACQKSLHNLYKVGRIKTYCLKREKWEFMIGLFVEILAVLVASAFVMIVHELLKSIAYVLTGRHCQKGDGWRIFRIFQYVDPIGWILFLTCNAGFSKPFMYRLKEKDTNAAIGLTGFLTLAVLTMAALTVYVLKVRFIQYDDGTDFWNLLSYFIVALNGYVILFSISLFIVNLVPTITSDMALLIMAVSPKSLIPLARMDAGLKGVLLLLIILGVVGGLSNMVINTISRFILL